MVIKKEKNLDTVVAYHAVLQRKIKDTLNSVDFGPGRLPCSIAKGVFLFGLTCLIVGILVITIRFRHVYLPDWNHQFVGPFFITMFFICFIVCIYLILYARKISNRYRREIVFRPIGDDGVVVIHRSTVPHEQKMKGELKSGTTPHQVVRPAAHGKPQKSYDNNGYDNRNDRPDGGRRHDDRDRRDDRRPPGDRRPPDDRRPPGDRRPQGDRRPPADRYRDRRGGPNEDRRRDGPPRDRPPGDRPPRDRPRQYDGQRDRGAPPPGYEGRRRGPPDGRPPPGDKDREEMENERKRDRDVEERRRKEIEDDMLPPPYSELEPLRTQRPPDGERRERTPDVERGPDRYVDRPNRGPDRYEDSGSVSSDRYSDRGGPARGPDRYTDRGPDRYGERERRERTPDRLGDRYGGRAPTVYLDRDKDAESEL